jgi:hypothetical protein
MLGAMKAMSRAEIVLQQMQDDYLQGTAACPNNVAFNTVIAACRVPRLQSRWSGPDTST